MATKRERVPAIPSLQEVKTILGDRTQDWSEEQLMGALAYVDTLAERIPPRPAGGHLPGCAWAGATLRCVETAKGVLCTCDPERPK